jgi:hypothetical protein
MLYVLSGRDQAVTSARRSVSPDPPRSPGGAASPESDDSGRDRVEGCGCCLTACARCARRRELTGLALRPDAVGDPLLDRRQVLSTIVAAAAAGACRRMAASISAGVRMQK